MSLIGVPSSGMVCFSILVCGFDPAGISPGHLLLVVLQKDGGVVRAEVGPGEKSLVFLGIALPYLHDRHQERRRRFHDVGLAIDEVCLDVVTVAETPPFADRTVASHGTWRLNREPARCAKSVRPRQAIRFLRASILGVTSVLDEAGGVGSIGSSFTGMVFGVVAPGLRIIVVWTS